MEYVLLAISFAVILAGALLFTNAIEWAGNKLEIGEGATGSILAAVGTAMPETLIPIVAIIGGAEGSEDVAIGAIIGAPFLLATIAMALVGISALIFKGRREQGTDLTVHVPTLDRDLIFFLIFFAAAILSGLVVPEALHIPLAVVFVLAYAAYVRATLRGGGDVQEAETIGPLYMDRTPGDEPPGVTVVLQLIVGLAAIVGGAHLFVEELIHAAEEIGLEPLVLSLVLAPLATELPEKANSFFWVKDGKDSLALGNITGAMVFQSTIPIAVGLALTDWELGRYAVLSGALGLAGGVVAYWALRLRGRFEALPVAIWAGAVHHLHRLRRDHLGDLGEQAEHLVVVGLRRGLLDHVRDLALGIDDEGRALDAHVLLAVHGLLDPGAVEVGNRVVGVGEQGEVEPVLAGELRDRLDRVRRDADHPGAGGLVVGAAVADAAGLGRASPRVGPWVEVEDDGLAAQVGEGDRGAVLVGEREVGRGLARRRASGRT